MTIKKSAELIFWLFLSTAFLQGCNSYDPVPASQCGKVVRNVAKVLGKMAPSSTEMMADCKKASDEKRGCALAARNTGDLSQCR